MHELRHVLATCDDGCPNGHYCKFVAEGIAEYTTVDGLGHPLVCSNDGGCQNKLRILRAASTHFLASLLSCLTHVFDIDKVLLAGDFRALMEITNTFESVLR